MKVHNATSKEADNLIAESKCHWVSIVKGYYFDIDSFNNLIYWLLLLRIEPFASRLIMWMCFILLMTIYVSCVTLLTRLYFMCWVLVQQLATNFVASLIHKYIFEFYGTPTCNRPRLYKPQPVVTGELVKILWEFTMNTDHFIPTNRPDIVIVDASKRSVILFYVAIPTDFNIVLKNRREYQNI